MLKNLFLPFTAISLMFLPNICLSQAPDTLWARRLNSRSNATCCVVDNNGYFYVMGYSWNGENNDFLTIKYNPVTGDTIWTKRYNGSPNGFDEAYGCAVDKNGYLYVTGEFYTGLDYDYLTIKYNASTGDIAWTKYYMNNGFDQARSCAVDDSGNLYITGCSFNGNNYDYLTIKYKTSSGDTVWSKRFNSPENRNDYAYGCAVDTQGYVYVTGSSTDKDFYTIKYSPQTGDTVWMRSYQDQSSQNDANCCVLDHMGNLYITGRSFNDATLNFECLTVKYNPTTGDTIWSRRYSSLTNGNGCAVDIQGNLYVVGTVCDTSMKYAIVKYSPTGEILWSQRYNGINNSDDYAYCCAVDNDGSLYVAGNTYDVVPYILTVKYGTVNGVEERSNAGVAPQKFILFSNNPNPFLFQTTIKYQLSSQDLVSISLYNNLGEIVKTIVNKVQNPGLYQITWDGRDHNGQSVSSGVYFYRLQVGRGSAIKKMILLK